jgi:hypothetical protein
MFNIFKRRFVVRRHEAQVIVNGYAHAPYGEMSELLNVQPLSANDLMALPEGERTVKRLKSFGRGKLMSAEESTGIPGDRLFYEGYWYECTSSVMWDHTILRHYRSEFVILPAAKQPPPPGVNVP